MGERNGEKKAGDEPHLVIFINLMFQGREGIHSNGLPSNNPPHTHPGKILKKSFWHQSGEASA